jgi:ABC-2 type transport system permease protein
VTLRLTFSQLRYVNKAFWRNPVRAFFTFVFPLMFLVIFTSLLGNDNIHLGVGAKVIKLSTYYVAAMAAFGVISACYNNIAMGVAFQRDAGVLKRVHGTPLPGGVFLGSQVLQATLVAALLVVLTAVFGRVAYGSQLPTGTSLVECVVMLLVGAAAFCALGLAVTAIIPNADASPAVVNASILPLLFLSGIFIPITSTTPTWIVWTARIFPIKHFAAGMQAAFIGTAFHWSDVAVVAAWGVGGLLLAVRFFSWEPRV